MSNSLLFKRLVCLFAIVFSLSQSQFTEASYVFNQIPNITIGTNDILDINLEAYISDPNIRFTLESNDSSAENFFQVSQRLSDISTINFTSENNWVAYDMLSIQAWNSWRLVAAINEKNQLTIANMSRENSETIQVDLNSDSSCTAVEWISEETVYVVCLANNDDQFEQIYVINATSGNFTKVSFSTYMSQVPLNHSNIRIERANAGPLKNFFYVFQNYDQENTALNGGGFLEVWSCHDPLNPFPLDTLIDFTSLGAGSLTIVDAKITEDFLYLLSEKTNNQYYKVELDPSLGTPKATQTSMSLKENTAIGTSSQIFDDGFSFFYFGQNSNIHQVEWSDNFYERFGLSAFPKVVGAEASRIYSTKELLHLVSVTNSSEIAWTVMTLNPFSVYWFERGSVGNFSGIIVKEQLNEVVFLNNQSFTLSRLKPAKLRSNPGSLPQPGTYNLTVSALQGFFHASTSFLVTVIDSKAKEVSLLKELVPFNAIKSYSECELDIPIDTSLVLSNFPVFGSVNSTQTSVKWFQPLSDIFENDSFSFSSTDILDVFMFENDLHVYNVLLKNGTLITYECSKISSVTPKCQVYAEYEVSSGSFVNFFSFGNYTGALSKNDSAGTCTIAFFQVIGGVSSMTFTFNETALSGCSKVNYQGSFTFYVACAAPEAKKVVVFELSSDKTSLDGVLTIDEESLGYQGFSPLNVVTDQVTGVLFILEKRAILAVKISLAYKESLLFSTFGEDLVQKTGSYNIAIGFRVALIISSELNAVQVYSTEDLARPRLRSSLPVDLISKKVIQARGSFSISKNSVFYATLEGRNGSEIIWAAFKLSHDSINSGSLLFSLPIQNGNSLLFLSALSSLDSDTVFVINNGTSSSASEHLSSAQLILNDPKIIHRVPATKKTSFTDSFNLTISSQIEDISPLNYVIEVSGEPSQKEIELDHRYHRKFYLDSSSGKTSLEVNMTQLKTFSPQDFISYYEVAAEKEEDIKEGRIVLANAVSSWDPIIFTNASQLGLGPILSMGEYNESTFAVLFESSIMLINKENSSNVVYDLGSSYKCKKMVAREIGFIGLDLLSICQKNGETVLLSYQSNRLSPAIYFHLSSGRVGRFFLDYVYLFLEEIDDSGKINLSVYLLDTVSHLPKMTKLYEFNGPKSGQPPFDIVDFELIFYISHNLIVLTKDKKILHFTFDYNEKSYSAPDVYSVPESFPEIPESAVLSYINCVAFGDFIFTCTLSTKSFDHFEVRFSPPNNEAFFIGTYLGYPGSLLSRRPLKTFEYFLPFYRVNSGDSSEEETRDFVAIYPKLANVSEVRIQNIIGTKNLSKIYTEDGSTPALGFEIELFESRATYLVTLNDSQSISVETFQTPTIRFNDIANMSSASFNLTGVNEFGRTSCNISFTDLPKTGIYNPLLMVEILIAFGLVLILICFGMEFTFRSKSSSRKPKGNDPEAKSQGGLSEPLAQADEENRRV